MFIRGLLLSGFVLAPLFISNYWLHLATLAGIGAILALGLNVCYGYCGQINFGTAAFYGIGAYTSAILVTKLGLSFPLALFGALISSGSIAVMIGIPLLRLREHSLALGTFAFSVLFLAMVNEFVSITHGFDGFIVSPPIVWGYKLGNLFYYYFTVFLSLLTYSLCNSMLFSRVGRAMEAIRSDEVLALSVGINITKYKLLAFVLNGLFAGLAGVLLVCSKKFVAPQDFTIWTSILIVLMVVVGGVGNNLGVVMGGILFMLLPELLIPFKTYHVIVYGVVLIVIINFFPRGIMSFVPRKGKIV
jgi:branched-chain amino acid transport system permease protein